MASVNAAQQLRRSMLYRTLERAGARFEALADGAVAVSFGAGDEVTIGRRMGIADLSPLARTGFKAKDTPQWLSGLGVEIPDAPNGARRQDDGALVARLSADEHFVLSDLAGRSDLVSRLDAAWVIDTERRCYHMPRAHSHCWLALTGRHTPEMLAKVCGVDMRRHKFPDHHVAQTSVARLNAIVIRNDLGETAAYYLLADSASADYLWPCLLDAMDEFDGGPVGLDALLILNGER